MDIFSLLLPKYTIDKNKKVRLITLFSGYDSQKLGFNYLDIDVEHYRAIEFDKYAIQSLNEIHNTNFETKDITKVSADDLGIVDKEKYTYIMTYSFPCTDLSLAGKRAGMDRESGTRSGLLWEVERLLKETKEKPQILIMENVPQVLSAKGWREWNTFLESLGYSNYCQILNAKDFGIPQNRERCFMVSILGEYSYEFPKPFKLKDRLKDFLEENVDDKYYLSKKMKSYIFSKNDKYQVSESSLILNREVACAVTTREGSSRADTSNYISDEKQSKADELLSLLYNNGEMKDIQQNNISPTLDTRCDCLGVVVKDSDVINPLKDKTPYGWHFEQQVYDENSVTRTIKAGEESGNIPKVMIKEYVGTIDYAQSDTLRPTMESRIKIDNEISGTLLQTGNQNGIIENNKPNGSYNYQLSDLRIRKLTPCECFKLMGVKPSDYNKITCSNAQKYKQAGNSIVTTCLMAIYSQLFENVDYKYYIEELLKELRTN